MKNAKQLLLVTTIIIWSFTTNAQDALTLGNRIVGGGLSFSLYDNENLDDYNNYNQLETLRSSSFKFSPYYGRLYDDNKLIGISLLVGTSGSDNIRRDNNYPGTNNRDELSFGAGIFIRTYFPISQNGGVFIQPGVNYERSISDNLAIRFTDSTFLEVNSRWISQTKSNLFSLNMKVGLYYFLLEKLSIETNLGSFVASMGKSNYSSESYYTNDMSPVNSNLHERNSSSVQFNLINQFTFDQIFKINYYF